MPNTNANYAGVGFLSQRMHKRLSRQHINPICTSEENPSNIMGIGTKKGEMISASCSLLRHFAWIRYNCAYGYHGCRDLGINSFPQRSMCLEAFVL